MHIRHALAAIMVAILWGGNFVAARIALDVFPPFWLLAVRFTIVSLLLLPFFPKPVGRLRDLAILSLLLGTLHFSLMFAPIALGLDVSAAVIASQLGVPFSVLLGIILFKDQIGRWRALGMLIAFCGVIVIAGSPSITQQYWQFLLACTGALAWAGGNIWVKRFHSDNMLGVLCWMSLLAIPQLLVISLSVESGQLEAVTQAGTENWAALTYTVLASTLLAYGTWYYLMSRFPVSQVVPYSLLVPCFGLGFAQWFFQEALTWQFLAGGACTIIGVGMIVLRRPAMMRVEQGS